MDNMPIKFNYTTDAEKYAQCYRLQEILRLEFNAGNLNINEHRFREDEVLKELLKLRDKIKNDNTINAVLNDIILP